MKTPHHTYVRQGFDKRRDSAQVAAARRLHMLNPLLTRTLIQNVVVRRASVRLPRTITKPLVLLIFYGVSGGPFGVEPVVAAGGPFLALLGFLLLPLVWSIPEAMVTAELSTTFPEPSGCVAWVSLV